MIWTQRFVVCTVFLFVAAQAIAQKPSVQDRLRSLDEMQRQRAGEEILAERRAMISMLTEVFRENMGHESRRRVAVSAVLLLGKLRADEAVNLLSYNLKYESKPIVVTRIFPSAADAYPCAGALAEIGIPSLNPLMRRVLESEEEDRLYSQLSAYVIGQVLGPGTSVAYVAQRLKSEKDTVKRKRLELLQQDLEASLKRNFPDATGA